MLFNAHRPAPTVSAINLITGYAEATTTHTASLTVDSTSVNPAAPNNDKQYSFWLDDDRVIVFYHCNTGTGVGTRVAIVDVTNGAVSTHQSVSATAAYNLAYVLPYHGNTLKYLVFTDQAEVYLVAAPASGTGACTITDLGDMTHLDGIGDFNFAAAWVNESNTHFVAYVRKDNSANSEAELCGHDETTLTASIATYTGSGLNGGLYYYVQASQTKDGTICFGGVVAGSTSYFLNTHMTVTTSAITVNDETENSISSTAAASNARCFWVGGNYFIAGYGASGEVHSHLWEVTSSGGTDFSATGNRLDFGFDHDAHFFTQNMVDPVAVNVGVSIASGKPEYHLNFYGGMSLLNTSATTHTNGTGVNVGAHNSQSCTHSSGQKVVHFGTNGGDLFAYATDLTAT